MGTGSKVQVQDPEQSLSSVQSYERTSAGSNHTFNTQVLDQDTSLQYQNNGNNQEFFRHNQCCEHNQDTIVNHIHSRNLTSTSLDNTLAPTMLDLSNMDSKDIIMAGYNDCTEEAIRYLTEVESIPLDDPIIVGLREHLSEKRRYLDYAHILHQLELELNAGATIDSDTTETSNLSYHGNSELANHKSTHDSFNNDHQNLHNDIYSISQCDEYIERLNNDNRDQTLSDSTNDVMETSYADGSSSIDGECNLTSINFALLVQNNPDIAHLTSELLYLLDAAPEPTIDEV